MSKVNLSDQSSIIDEINNVKERLSKFETAKKGKILNIDSDQSESEESEKGEPISEQDDEPLDEVEVEEPVEVEVEEPVKKEKAQKKKKKKKKPEPVPESESESETESESEEEDYTKLKVEVTKECMKEVKYFGSVITKLMRKYSKKDLADEEFEQMLDVYGEIVKELDNDIQENVDKLPKFIDLSEKDYISLEKKIQRIKRKFTKFAESL